MYDSNLKPAFLGRCEVANLIGPSGFEVVSYDFVFDADVISHEECMQ